MERLEGGLVVALLEDPRAHLVCSCLWYRAGARDEVAGQEGVAHFLEHMMFKGTPFYGAGEIDRRTLALGGVNNAFTSHDATAYYFQFASDRWREALALESDRMAGLTLDRREVETERRVILEEIASFESDPWDCLELAVHAELFRSHPYGRSVLGGRDSLWRIGRSELEAFHRCHYRCDNAVLVVAGDLGPRALEAVHQAFGALSPGGRSREAAPVPRFPTGQLRVLQRRGEVPRFLLAFPAGANDSPGNAELRLLAAVLAVGRASRLHRRLVEELQQCLWVSAGLSDHQGPGVFTIAGELHPGVEPLEVEKEVLQQLYDLGEECVEEWEVERGRRLLASDWVMAHEPILELAMAAGFALALFDETFHDRTLERALGCDREELRRAAGALRPEGGSVVGWSLPGEPAQG